MSVVLTLAVVATWVVLATAALALGTAFLRLFVHLEPAWRNAFLSILTGFALLFQFLTLWHFAFPVNGAAVGVVLAASIAALVWQRQWIAALGHDRPAPIRAWPIALFLIWTANQALGQAGWDDYNYELQAVRWFHDYPLVPGLANLHGRLGFNNSHHLYAALLSTGPWAGAVNHLVNGLFIVLAVAYCWNAWVDLREGRVGARTAFTALLLGPSIGAAIIGSEFGLAMMSTLKADIAVSVLTVIAACLWIEFHDRETPGPTRAALAVTITLLLVWLFSIKISAAVFVFILLAGLAFSVARDSALRRLVAPLAIAAAVGIAAVVIRGIVLSGYPLYPSTLLDVAVDWRVPEQQAQVERLFINTWGRLRATFDPPGNTQGWFAPWVRFIFLTNRTMLVVPVLVAISLTLSMAIRIRVRDRWADGWGWGVLALACVASLVVWFIEAPDSRFAWSYCWILAAAAIAASIVRHPVPALASTASPVIIAVVAGTLMFWSFDFSRSQRAAVVLTLAGAAVWTLGLMLAAHARRQRLFAALCLILAAAPVVDRLASHILFRRRAGDVRTFVWANVRTLRNAPGDPVTPRRTHAGFTVYETLSSDYDTPLPSTPYFNRYLELRQPGNLRWGFRNAGPTVPFGLGYRPRIGGSTPDE